MLDISAQLVNLYLLLPLSHALSIDIVLMVRLMKENAQQAILDLQKEVFK